MKPNILAPVLLSLLALAFAAPARANSCATGEPIKQVSLAFTSREGTAALCGFPEFVSPSTPPKKYLKKVLSGTRTRKQGPSGAGPYSGNEPFFTTTTETISGSAEYTLPGGTEGANSNNVVVNGGSPQALEFWFPNPPYGNGSNVFNVRVTLKTTTSVTGTGVCANGGITGWQQHDGDHTATLIDEDTAVDAEQRALAGATPGTSNTAYRLGRTTGFSFGFRKVHYEAAFDVGCSGEYDAIVTYATKPHGTATVTGHDTQVIRKTMQPGRHTISGDIRVVQDDTDYTVESIELRPPCGQMPPGASDFRLDSVHVELSLGLGAKQESAGFLRLQAETVTAALYTPAALTVATADSAEETIRDGTAALRQVKAPQALADIVTLDATTYEVRFHAPAQIGAQDPGTKIYAVSGTPFATYKFENPDPGQTTRLRITETRGAVTRVNEYAYDSGTTTWTLSRGNNQRQESLVLTTAGSDTTKTTTIRDGSNTVVSQTAKTYRTYPWGEELISEVRDPDGAALTTSHDFYSNAATDGGAYGHLKQRIHPDGSWERYTYDATGRPLKTIRPFLDAPVTAAENLCRVTENTYGILADADADGQVEQLTTTVESTLGQETGRTYRVDWSKTVTLGTDVCTRRTDHRCVAPGAAWNAAANLVTETLLYTVDPFIGRTRRMLNPDGTATLASYSIDANGQQTAVVKTGAPNAAKDDITAGTRTTRFTSAQGQVTGEAIADIAGNLTLSTWTATQFDPLGRPTRLDYPDGTYVTRDYACCGLAGERDRSGLVTTHTYDDLGREITTSRSGLTIRTGYDAADNVKSVTRIGSDNSEQVRQTSTYDLAGRLTEQRDALDRLTTYAATFDAGTGRTTRTTTTPAGTRIEITARDGSLLSVAGTAAAPRTYEYGLETGQLFTKQILVGDGGATTEWVKTFTDFAGRTVREERPAASGTTVTLTFAYNPLGQLAAQSDADGVTTLFAYNARGEQEVTALDLDADGVIDYDGTDRITKTVNTAATRDTYTVQRSTTQVWETDGQDTPTTVSVAETSSDGLRSWQTIRGLTTATVTTLDGSGGRTVTATAPDGTVTTQVFSNDLLQSTIVAHPSLGTLASAGYAYDPHGRLTTSSLLAPDSSLLPTTYTYFADDQLHTTTTPDPDPARSGPGYDPQTTTYTYDSAGRVSTATQPDGGVVTTEYYPIGLVKKVFGARIYPEERTYDSQGRLKTLKTWQDYANDSGAVVTTWNYHPQRGWLDNKRYADNQGPGYTYTLAGRLQTRTWARGIVTTYGYSAGGDLNSVDYSDSTPDVTIQYDRSGRPKTRTDAAGLCTWTYDISGQLKDEDYTAGLLDTLGVHRTFDSLARLDSVSVPSVSSVGYTYDASSRLDTVTSGANTATYGYVPNSPLVGTITFQQGANTRLTISKVHDNLNRLASILSAPSASSAVSAAYNYNSANQRTKLTREDSRYWDYGYDSLGQVTSAKKYLSGGGAMLGHDFEYTFDDMGNRKTATVNSQISNYSANSLNQYSSRTVPGVFDVMGEAQADATVTVMSPATNGTIHPALRQGDWFYRQLTVDNSTEAQFPTIKITGVKNNVGANGEDAVTEVTKSTLVAQTPESFGHDADGNLTADAKWTYSWDGENRLIAMETTVAAVTAGLPKRKLEFAYDGQSRRVSKKVYDWVSGAWALSTSLHFVYDGWNLLAEVNDTGVAVRTYAWGTDLSGSLQGAGGVGGLLFVNLGSATHAPAFDGNGNVCAYVDMSSGVKSATYEYDAFGETLIADGTAAELFPFRFSTKFTDNETGLLYYGLRYYSPSMGRWLSRDPVSEEGGPNLSAFVENDALNYTDLLGLKTITFNVVFDDSFSSNPRKRIAEQIDELKRKIAKCCRKFKIGCDIDVVVNSSNLLTKPPVGGYVTNKDIIKATRGLDPSAGIPIVFTKQVNKGNPNVAGAGVPVAGLVLGQTAPDTTLSHELGHVAGANYPANKSDPAHSPNSNELMYYTNNSGDVDCEYCNKVAALAK